MSNLKLELINSSLHCHNQLTSSCFHSVLDIVKTIVILDACDMTKGFYYIAQIFWLILSLRDFTSPQSRPATSHVVMASQSVKRARTVPEG